MIEQCFNDITSDNIEYECDDDGSVRGLVTEAVVAEFSQSEVSEAQQQQRSQWDRGGQGGWSVVQTVITINHNTAYWS